MKDKGGRMKDERNADWHSFILHPSAFILPSAGILFVAAEREG
jgi:hypothetical protein